MRAVFMVVPLMALLAASVVYCVVVIAGVARYLRSVAPQTGEMPPASILVAFSSLANHAKPRAGPGREAGTNAVFEYTLRSLFEQQYPRFEVLILVPAAAHGAAGVARRVMETFPHIPARLIVAAAPPFPNSIAWTLHTLLPEARHETLVVAGDGVRIEPGGLATMLGELSQPGVALVTCPYRASPGSAPHEARFWPRLEALGLNTELIGNLLAARLLGGIDFAPDAAFAMRRADLEAIGGAERLQRYFADGLRLEMLTRRRGKTVVLSRCIADRAIGNGGFRRNMEDRVWWARRARLSRPAWYACELVTKTTALALLLWIVAPDQWEFAVLALIYRSGAQWATGIWLLEDPLVVNRWWLLPLEDVVSFVLWITGLFGNSIAWRGQKLKVARDGSFEMKRTAGSEQRL